MRNAADFDKRQNIDPREAERNHVSASRPVWRPPSLLMAAGLPFALCEAGVAGVLDEAIIWKWRENIM